MKIGAHLSSANGFYKMAQNALDIGANTFQFFSRNPRGTKARDLDHNDLEKMKQLMKDNGFAQIVVHAPYTMNACSADSQLRNLAAKMLADDLKRLEFLPGHLYNFHPGSHVGQGADMAIDQISHMLNNVLFQTQQTTVLLETMSGKGTEIGGNFKELRSILDQISLKNKVGVCMDACHLFSAGYDIVNHLDDVLDEFDQIIGLEYLYAFHLNDSKNSFASNKDRHERIGEGFIGLETILTIINHPKLQTVPFILETPHELQGHAEEIRLLKASCRKI